MRRPLLFFAVLFGSVVVNTLTACPARPPIDIGEGEGEGEGAEGEGEGGTDVASVVVQPAGGIFCADFCSVEAGKTFALEARVLDAAGATLARAVTWSSEDESLALVDDAGVVTGVAPGFATIHAAVDGVA